MSSGELGIGSKASRPPWASVEGKRTAPSICHGTTNRLTRLTTKFVSHALTGGSMSPTPVTMTVLTGILPTISCGVCATFSRTTMEVAPESLSCCSNSRGGIQRIAAHGDNARAQRTEQRNAVLKQIRQHDGHAVAGTHAPLPLQVGAEAAALPVELGIGHHRAHAAERG